MLEMVDYYGGTILILALATCEIIAFNWIYGTNLLGNEMFISFIIFKTRKIRETKVLLQEFYFFGNQTKDRTILCDCVYFSEH